MMGTRYKVDCSCGYHKELSLGQGLFAFNSSSARRMFGDAAFDTYEKEKGLQMGFSLANELCLCKKCSELLNQATFTYRTKSGKEVKMVKECNTCHTVPTLIKEPVCCPKCNKKLELTPIGSWD